MRRRTAKGEGMLARKVARLLEDLLSADYPGISVNSGDFWFQAGDYVKATWDLARWGADIPHTQGVKVAIYSWDTMRQCAKGITKFKPRGALPNEWEIVASV